MAAVDEKLLDELGDLLFQVYFLALLLEEQGEGDLEDVARGVHEKLVRRHPHVFGEADAPNAGRVRQRWEQIKTEQEGREGVFHDVPESLPALLYARKVQRRVESVGYDWPDLAGPLAKVREELASWTPRCSGSARGRDRAGRPGRRGARRPAVHGRERGAKVERRSGAGAARHDAESSARASSAPISSPRSGASTGPSSASTSRSATTSSPRRFSHDRDPQRPSPPDP